MDNDDCYDIARYKINQSKNLACNIYKYININSVNTSRYCHLHLQTWLQGWNISKLSLSILKYRLYLRALSSGLSVGYLDEILRIVC